MFEVQPIEHRVFWEISKKCAGQPLMEYETVINHLSTTRTKTGLRVDAHLVQADYPISVKVSEKEMDDLPVRGHDTQPTQLHGRPQVTGRLKLGSYFASSLRPWRTAAHLGRSSSGTTRMLRGPGGVGRRVARPASSLATGTRNGEQDT